MPKKRSKPAPRKASSAKMSKPSKTASKATSTKKTKAKPPVAKKVVASKTRGTKAKAKTGTKTIAAKAKPKTVAKKIAAKPLPSIKPVVAVVPMSVKSISKPVTPIAKPINNKVPKNDFLSSRGFTPYQEKSNEDYMGSAQLMHFRAILNAWKKELMEEVDRTVHHMQDEAANFPDLSDRATQEEEFSLELRARDRERKLIKKIDETLEKIKHQEYGYCDACGVEIGIRRLEARPTATLCIDCKTLDEIKEKQIHG